MENFNFADFQTRTSQLVTQQCREQEGPEPLLIQLRQVADEAEEIIENYHAGDRSLIDCAPGCSSCCVVNVSTLFPEGLAIVAYLKEQGEQQVVQTAERLERLWREVRGLDDEDRLFLRRSCAFLDEDGCCSIYPVRPLLCRSVTSTDANSCREALAGKVLGEETSVLMHQFQNDLYETLFTGVGAGLEASGLDGRSFQLTGLIRYLLRYPAVESQWFAGQRLTWQELY